ncbi:polyketide synthase dehydratase domain-containing protein, partial [Streptomyces sp. NEAU-S77]|uniref:polyketide synthase dehydratase domain-containing protein n=1 Tax=Streptomyces sp. NEAU-S77 TaxID=3411033 RepID=UPI003B9EBF89
MQVLLTERDQGWAVEIHACPDGTETWTRHATGLLTSRATDGDPHEAGSGAGEITAGGGAVFDGAWPPAGATAVDISDVYDAGMDTDVVYGPAFQGLTRAWTQGEDRVWAEVELPGTESAQAGTYGIHPALLDSVLHAAMFAGLDSAESTRLPFSFTDVVLAASGAARVRVCLTRTGSDEVSIAVADGTGAPVMTIGSLLVRPLPEGALGADPQDTVVLEPHWTDVRATGQAPRTDDWTVVGSSAGYADVADLSSAVSYGMPVPERVVLDVPHTPAPDSDSVVARVHEVTVWVLEQVQHWLGERRFDGTRLVVVTRGAVTTGEDDRLTDLPAAGVVGLVRSAQTENPDRITLVDLEPAADLDLGVLAQAVATGEPQVAVRRRGTHTALLAPRLTRDAGGLLPPADGLWHLDTAQKGTLEGLAFVPCPELAEPLAAGQVRIQVRAAGLNFRDVLNALGMYPGDAGPLGGEAAGVVTEVGPGVDDLCVGDRVMGIVPASFGPVADTDHRYVVPMPDGWTFTEAASVPIVFLTAYYGLVDLAGLLSGESLLVHAGAGGVGMAAIQLARHFG